MGGSLVFSVRRLREGQAFLYPTAVTLHDRWCRPADWADRASARRASGPCLIPTAQISAVPAAARSCATGRGCSGGRGWIYGRSPKSPPESTGGDLHGEARRAPPDPFRRAGQSAHTGDMSQAVTSSRCCTGPPWSRSSVVASVFRAWRAPKTTSSAMRPARTKEAIAPHRAMVANTLKP